MDESHKAILDRDNAQVLVKEHLKDAVDLLNELLDYGTNLIPRAYGSSNRDIKATCLLFVQLQQFLAHLDGLCVLIASGAAFTSCLQLRSMWEGALIMEWILKADTDEKIRHLYVANLRKRRQWNSKIIPGTPEALRDPDAIRMAPLTPDQLKGLTDEVAGIDAILSQAPYDQISAKFESNYQSRFFDKSWHDVYGGGSIKKIAESLNKEKQYNYFYSPYSGISHGSDIWKSVTLGSQVKMNALREVSDIPQVANLAATLTMSVYEMILDTYRPHERTNFAQKYKAEWQTRFMKRYNFKVEPIYVSI
jgi:hypothetical protein